MYTQLMFDVSGVWMMCCTIHFQSVSQFTDLSNISNDVLKSFSLMISVLCNLG